MRAPGTWHDTRPQEQVEFQLACAKWAEAALPELEKVASKYGATITYKELADSIQGRTGYRTKMQLANWIGKVLDIVVRRTVGEELPPLTSLVVHKDTGGVGAGYYNKSVAHGGFDNEDQLQRIAAEDRLVCYRVYCSSVPADASPQYTARYRERTSGRVPAKTAVESKRPICPKLPPGTAAVGCLRLLLSAGSRDSPACERSRSTYIGQPARRRTSAAEPRS